jgi:hypothetical protein
MATAVRVQSALEPTALQPTILRARVLIHSPPYKYAFLLVYKNLLDSYLPHNFEFYTGVPYKRLNP